MSISTVRKKELTSFLNSLGFYIRNLNLLNAALTHSSYLKEHSTKKHKGFEDNERLEFFGDAVLKLFISEYLLNKYKDYSEGQLSTVRAYVVSEKVLAKIGEKLNLKKYLLLGKNEKASLPDSILGDAVESLLAVIYFECGPDKAREFILSYWEDFIELAEKTKAMDNYKALLQEHTQANKMGLPLYKTLYEIGPDHKKEFEVGVYLNNNELARGKGKTKKSASQSAAKNALISLSKL